MFQKSELKNNKDFITQDLAPLQDKLLNYMKNYCEKKFVLCHTINRNIRMKKSAECDDESSPNEEDQGIGNWLVISTPDDLFK